MRTGEALAQKTTAYGSPDLCSAFHFPSKGVQNFDQQSVLLLQ